MEPRYFHGDLTPIDVGRSLIAEFNRGDLRAQQFGTPENLIVQIATLQMPTSGGKTTLTVNIQKVEDGIAVTIGNQEWLGVVASLGQTAFSTWRNPWNLLSRLDDLAQDIENLQLPDKVWRVIEKNARLAGANFELSQRLKRITCRYCDTANPVGESACIACGAPLGKSQPRTCPKCGFVTSTNEATCPNCRTQFQ